MAPPRPHAVAFDVVETSFSLDAVAEALERVGVGRETLAPFFASLLRDAFALSAAGDPHPFVEVARATLTTVAPALADEARVEVMSSFRALDPQPDLAPALDRLAAAEVPALALTNGSAEVTAGLFDRAGLADRIDRIISVDEARVWKPRAELYLYAAEVMSVAPGALALVAVHPWDLHGASRAGLLTGWVSRHDAGYPDVFAPPDVSGADLVTVVEGLLAL